MAIDPSLEHLGARKLELLREVLHVTQRALILVDLDELGPLLEQKNGAIAAIARLDGEAAEQGGWPQPTRDAVTKVVASILENEKALEERMLKERNRLRQELREFDQQTRMRTYLEGTRRKGGRVDLTR